MDSESMWRFCSVEEYFLFRIGLSYLSIDIDKFLDIISVRLAGNHRY
jgi:hypothetical protein